MMAAHIMKNLKDDEYVVERILDKRINPITKQIEYFLKWEGYPSSDNSWEPISQLDCPGLINEYEQSLMVNRHRRLMGFGRRLKAEEVLSSCKTKSGELLFLMKWTGVQQADLVPAQEACVRCPDVVFRYIEPLVEYQRNMKRDYDLSSSNVDMSSNFGRIPPAYLSLQIENILNLTEDSNGDLLFVLKWHGIDQPEFVYSQYARKQYPFAILTYYLSRMTWPKLKSRKYNKSDSPAKKLRTFDGNASASEMYSNLKL